MIHGHPGNVPAKLKVNVNFNYLIGGKDSGGNVTSGSP